MALSRSSVLHYWSARFGTIPIIGGNPVHTRNSTAKWVDQMGQVRDAPVNTPRAEWATIDGERRPVMRLEDARTSALLNRHDFANASWTKSSVTVTSGRPDPAGGLTAFTLTATGATGDTTQNLSAGSSLVRANSIWARLRTSVGGSFTLLQPDGAAFNAMALTSNWQRFSSVGAASTAREFRVRINGNGGELDVWAPQMDDAASVSSTITPAAAATTRSADSFYWDYLPSPEEVMAYLRFVERGTLLAGGRVFEIADASDADPRLLVYSGAGFYNLVHDTGASSTTASIASGVPAVGATVEILARLTAATIEIIQSINGGAVTTGSASGIALASAWSAPRLWLNSAGTIGGYGLADFAEVKMVKHADVAAATAQGRMDELRAFELAPSGEVVS